MDERDDKELDMGQRDSLMLSIEGVDGAAPRLVARADVIDRLAEMAASDLGLAQTTLALHPLQDYEEMDAGELTKLLELHTRAVNALQVLLATRHPDELVEMHIP